MCNFWSSNMWSEFLDTDFHGGLSGQLCAWVHRNTPLPPSSQGNSSRGQLLKKSTDLSWLIPLASVAFSLLKITSGLEIFLRNCPQAPKLYCYVPLFWGFCWNCTEYDPEVGSCWRWKLLVDNPNGRSTRFPSSFSFPEIDRRPGGDVKYGKSKTVQWSLSWDTLAKGHLSNKDRITRQQVLWSPLILPLTEGHLSNEARIYLAEGVSLLEGYCSMCNTTKTDETLHVYTTLVGCRRCKTFSVYGNIDQIIKYKQNSLR